MSKKNIVLTILHNYSYPFIEPFIKSFFQAKVDAELVIFTSESVSFFTRQMLKDTKIKLIYFNSKNPLLSIDESLTEGITKDISINNFRFLLFLDFLLKNKEKYENVMMTDIRDVIFQVNPFNFLPKESICFFLEDPIMSFKDTDINYGWSVEANGKAFTDSIFDRRVSCAGITSGNIRIIIDYLQNMRENLKGRQQLKWGIDQGIHNGYLYGQNNIPKSIFDNSHRIVGTLGACKIYDLNSNTEVTNNKNEIYCIVHQYDRISELFLIMKKKYIGDRFIQIAKRILFVILP